MANRTQNKTIKISVNCVQHHQIVTLCCWHWIKRGHRINKKQNSSIEKLQSWPPPRPIFLFFAPRRNSPNVSQIELIFNAKPNVPSRNFLGVFSHKKTTKAHLYVWSHQFPFPHCFFIGVAPANTHTHIPKNAAQTNAAVHNQSVQFLWLLLCFSIK